jgi:hypothetical protein
VRAQGDKDQVESTSKLLRKVSIPDAFLFFSDAEHYTGEFATSLAKLAEKLDIVPLKSIEFHFQRGDYEKWVGRTLGDNDLAGRLSSIDRSMQGEELRTIMRRIIQRRLEELGGTA